MAISHGRYLREPVGRPIPTCEDVTAPIRDMPVMRAKARMA